MTTFATAQFPARSLGGKTPGCRSYVGLSGVASSPGATDPLVDTLPGYPEVPPDLLQGLSLQAQASGLVRSGQGLPVLVPPVLHVKDSLARYIGFCQEVNPMNMSDRLSVPSHGVTPVIQSGHNMDTKRFGKWLKRQLDEHNPPWNQSDLARATVMGGQYVSQAQIGRAIRGERGLGEKSVTAIAKALEIPPEVVYREAGLLPPKEDESPTAKTVSFLVSQMPLDRQLDILEYTRLQLRRVQRQGKDAKKNPRGIEAAGD